VVPPRPPQNQKRPRSESTYIIPRIRFRAGAAHSGAVQFQTPWSQQTAQPARLHQRRLARIRTWVREPIPARFQDGELRRRSRGRRSRGWRPRRRQSRQVKSVAPPHPRTLPPAASSR
jgi:hypothetical protein